MSLPTTNWSERRTKYRFYADIATDITTRDSQNVKTHVRCCIYLTTYDWIKSFLKITEEGRAIYGNLETGNKINTLYWSVENSIPKNSDRSREGVCSIV